MVNFKYLSLPLLVGLINNFVRGAEVVVRTCSFEKDGNDYGKYKLVTDDKATPPVTQPNCVTGFYLLGDDLTTVVATGKTGKLYYFDKTTSSNSRLFNNPVPGYYKHAYKDDTNDIVEFISCNANGECKFMGELTESTCNDSKAGSLYKFLDTSSTKSRSDPVPEYRLCLGAFKSGSVGYLNIDITEGNYLVKNNGNIFNFNNAVDYFVVKSDGASITFDPTYTRREDQCVNKDGKLITRFEDFCDTENSSGKYITCMNGSCIGTSQENGSKTNISADPCEITVTAKTTFVDASCSASAKCNSNNNGYHLGTDATGNKYLTLFNVSGDKRTCEVIEEPSVGYYRLALSKISVSSGQIKDSYQYVIECKDINDDVGCQLIQLPTTEGMECDSDNAGKLINSNYNAVLCLDENESQRFVGSDPVKKFVKAVEGSIFGRTAQKYYPVDITSNYIIYDKDYDKSGILMDGGRVNCNGSPSVCSVSNLKFNPSYTYTYVETPTKTPTSQKFVPSATNYAATDKGYYFIDDDGKTVTDTTTDGYIVYYDGAGSSTTVTEVAGIYMNHDGLTSTDFPYIICKIKNIKIDETQNENVEITIGGKTYNNIKVKKVKCNLRAEPTTDICSTDGNLVKISDDNGEESVGLCVNSKGIKFESHEYLYGLDNQSIGFIEGQRYYELQIGQVVDKDTNKVTDEYIKFNTVSKKGYISVSNDSDVINCVKRDDATELDTSNCNKVTANEFDYYYYSEDYIIYCDGSKKCTYLSRSDYVGKNGLFHVIYGGDRTYVISAKSSGGTDAKFKIQKGANYYPVSSGSSSNYKFDLINCSGVSCNMESGIGRGVYLYGSDKGLIICTASQCGAGESTDNPLQSDIGNKYYLNAGSDKEDKPLITVKGVEITSAEGTKTIVYKWVTDAASVKTLYVNENGNKKLIYCEAQNSCEEIDAVSSKYIDGLGKKVIDCTVSGNKCNKLEMFTQSQYGTNVYLIDNNNRILQDNVVSGSLIKCTYREKKEGEDEDQKSCEGLEVVEGNYYVDSYGSNLIDSNKNIIIKSKVASGYYRSSDENKYIECTKGTGCSEKDSAADCNEDGSAGKIKKGSGDLTLCIDENATLNTSGKHIKNLSYFPGSSGDILISVESNKIVEVTPTSIEYYITDENGILLTEGNKAGNLYKCSTAGCEGGNVAGIYNNADINTVVNFQIIQCDDEAVSKRDGEGPTCIGKERDTEINCLTNNNLYSCAEDAKCDSTFEGFESVCKQQIVTAGYYVLPKGSNEGIIQCTSSGATVSCEKNTEVKEGYYISQDRSKPLIKCEKSLGKVMCISVDIEDINDGVYLRKVVESTNVVNALLKCTGKLCEEIDMVTGYYLSGEPDKKLVYCDGTTKLCESDSKPSEGWYANAVQSGKGLIKCTIDGSKSFECNEEVTKVGTYINAGVKEDGKKLIVCTLSGCTEEEPEVEAYYVDGENSKLIYSDINSKLILIKDPGVDSWYLSKEGEGNLIKCYSENDNVVCKEYMNEQLGKGYYINGDSYSNYEYPLIRVISSTNSNFEKGKVSTKGWYVHEDDDVGKKIIKCTSESSCSLIDVSVDECSLANGKFSTYYGDIVWCNGEEIVSIRDTSQQTYVVAAITDFDKDIVLPDGYVASDTYVILKKASGNGLSLAQVNTNGYYYDRYKEKLYKCSNDSNGYCTIISQDDIVDGFYFNFKPPIDSEKIIRCENKKCSYYTLTNTDTKCGSENVGFKNGVYLCQNGDLSTTFNFEELTSEKVYVLKSKNFPGVKGRYVMVNISKYSLLFKEEVEELAKCTTSTEAGSVCLSVTAVKQQSDKYTLVKGTTTITTAGDIEISVSGKDEKIKYDFETNAGYFKYNIKSGEAELVSLFIPKEDFKYECKIDGQCIERELAEELIYGYDVTDEGVPTKIVAKASVKRSDDDSKVIVLDEIKNGWYAKKGSGCIECKDGSCEPKTSCVIERETGTANIKYGTYKSDPSHNKVVSKINTGKRRRATGSDSDDIVIYELNYVSLTEINDSRNIFTDGDNVVLSSDDSTISNAYSCIEGKCKRIVVEDDKYYLNTIQSGKKINAVVKCYKVTGGSQGTSCIFIDAVEGNMYENAAGTGIEDALIKCTNEKCEVTKAESEVAMIPECKPSLSTNDPYINPITLNCIRSDNSLYLLQGQHCIYKGDIYIYDTYTDNSNPTSPKTYLKCYNVNTVDTSTDVKMFDITYRKINIENMKEKRIGSSIYTKVGNGKWHLTNGYIVNVSTKVFSKCMKSECEEMKSIEGTSCENEGAGSLILDANKNIKLCKSDVSSGAVDISEDKYYPIELFIDGNFPEASTGDRILVGIEKIGANNVYVISKLVSDKFILLATGNAIASSSHADNKLYQCTSSDSNCVILEKNNGWYSSEDDGKFIKCEDGTCGEVSEATEIEYISEKFDSIDNGEFIYKDNNLMIRDENSFVQFKVNNYVLLNEYENRLAEEDEVKEMKVLLKCNESYGKCIKEEDIKDGWYVNGDTEYKGIKCSNGSCVVVKELSNSCGNNNDGDLIYDTSSNEYSLCYSKTLISLKNNVGKKISLSSNNKFPNNKDYVVVMSNSVIGIGNIGGVGGNVESSVCTNNCKNGSSVQCKITVGEEDIVLPVNSYCTLVQGEDITIYKGKDAENSEKAFTEGNSVILIDGNSLITNVDNVGPSTEMYYCIKGSCKVGVGYKKLGDSIVKCGADGCEKYETPGSVSIGDISSGNLQYDESKSGGGDSNRLYYYINKSNVFPGSENKSSFLVEAGLDYYVIFKGKGYYLLGSDNKMLEGSSAKNNDYAGDKLYLCDELKGNCIVQETKSNGYFVNAVDESMILCKANKCYIAYIVDDSCSKLGNVVKKDGKYKFCNVKGTNSPIEIKESSSVNYYMLSLGRGDKFAGITIPDEEANDEVVVNIIVKYTGTTLTQYTKEGYILRNGDNIVENVNGSGNMYKCEKEKYIGTTETVQCKLMENINSGWYFSDNYENNKYISCDNTKESNKCNLMEAVESKTCQNSGILIYNNEELKVCVRSDKQVGIKGISEKYAMIMNVSNTKDFPGFKVKTTNIEIITSISSNSVTWVDMDTFVVVNDEKYGRRVITTAGSNVGGKSEEGNLYRCTAQSGCKVSTNPEENWYIMKDISSGEPNNLILCETESGSSDSGESKMKCTMTDKNVKEGFYANWNKEKPLIQCVQPGEEKEGKFTNSAGKKVVCFEKDYKEGWYISGNGKLINCNKEFGCYEESSPRYGLYVNNEANDNIYKNEEYTNKTIYKLIKCKGGSSANCVSYTKETVSQCSNEKPGEINVDNTGNYKFCLSKVDHTSDKVEAVDFIKSSGKKYGILKISSTTDDFPVSEAGYNLVEISSNEISVVNKEGYYYIDDIMFNCKSTGKCEKETSGGITVLDSVSNVMMTSPCTEGSSCNDNWIVDKSDGIILLDTNNKIISTVDNVNVKKAYKCKDNKCIEVNYEGYYYNKNAQDENGNNVLYQYKKDKNGVMKWSIVNNELLNCRQLSEYKPNNCYISYEDEKYKAKLEEIKVDAGGICVSSTNKYLALKEINTGIDVENCVQMPSEADVSTYYYNVNGNAYAVDKYSYMNIGGNGQGVVINSLNGEVINNNKKLNKILKDDYNTASEYIISCNEGNCVSKVASACTYDFQSGKCKALTENVNSGEVCITENRIYLALENLTTSSEGSCTPYLYKKMNSGEDVKDEGDSLIKVANKKLYEITSSNEIYKYSDGIYIVNEADRVVELEDDKEIDISGKSNLKLYVCNKECKLKTSCGVNGKDEYMFYKNDNNELTYDKLYKCNSKNNKLSIVKERKGYYLNSAFNNLIKCYDSGDCKVLDEENGMEGYYVDGGNEGLIIKCIRGTEKFVCKEESVVACEYNSKEGVCKSEDNLLRNSYCYRSGKSNENKLIYVENFIKAGDKGKCIANDGKDYFYKYKKSKFLGHKERDDLIKFSEDSIVSIFENNIGYYIFNTETHNGVEKSVELKKTRMYECKKQNCEEILKPQINKVYINKASTEKLIKYDGSQKSWDVIKRRCVINNNNTKQCTLSESISKGELIYVVYDDEVKFYKSRYDVSNYVTRNPVNDDDEKKSHYSISDNKYHLLQSNFDPKSKVMLMLNSGKQTVDWVEDEGYYIFEKSEEEINLIPYRNTQNVTLDKKTEITVYQKGDSWKVISDVVKTFSNIGIYWNKASINDEGVVIQSMSIPIKEEQEEEGSARRKRATGSSGGNSRIKSVLNKCIVNEKNKCINVQEGEIIPVGSPCIVSDGEYSGLYLAISPISENASSENCVKYDEGTSYVNLDDVEFSGGYVYNSIVRVEKNEMLMFTDGGNDNNPYIGYYIIGEKNKPFNLTVQTELKGNSKGAYLCGYRMEENPDTNEMKETDIYECSSYSGEDAYYYANDNIGSNGVYYGKGNKWMKESSSGYYFFNSKNVAANIKEEIPDTGVFDGYGNAVNNGKYINSAVTDSNNEIVVVNNYEGSYTINTDIKKCKVNNDETCDGDSEEVTLTDNDICYTLSGNTKKLYIVEVSVQESGEESVTKKLCHTGGVDAVKYYMSGSNLYRLDGLSVQGMKSGIFVLNDKMEGFSSDIYEIPYKVIECGNGNCAEKEIINVESDVIINGAGNGNNQLLKYNKLSKKFMNVDQPGYYLFNEDGSVNGDERYSKLYELTKDGELKTLTEDDINMKNIYINFAKEGEITLGLKKIVSGIIEYDSGNKFLKIKNSNKIENVFVIIDNKLYKKLTRELDEVDEGIYAMKKNGNVFEPFINTVEENLNTAQYEVCYYDGKSLPCNVQKLEEFKKRNVMVNKSNGKENVLEYNSGTKLWKIVKDDGYYFFFEDGYGINKADNRVNKVLQIVNGNVNDVTEGIKKSGFYVFKGLMVENTNDKWEDAELAVDNVVVTGRKGCKSYEIRELIEPQEFCYESSRGICIPKVEISQKSDDNNNCMFSTDDGIYYYLVDDSLYALSKDSYNRIEKSGIYVVDLYGKIYDNKKENRAIAYSCKEGKCGITKSLKSKYYMNFANDNKEIPVILYYDSEKSTWVKTSKDGYYFFNENGKSVSVGKEVAYAFEVRKEGMEIVNIMENVSDGKYVSQSNPSEAIIVEMKGVWQKPVSVPTCTVEEDGITVTSSEPMESGDICIDNKQIVIIKGESELAKRDGEYSYKSVSSVGRNAYAYIEKDKQLLRVKNDQISVVNVNGYVLLDKSTGIPLESNEEVEGELYSCNGKSCELVNSDKIDVGNRYVNKLAEKLPLIKNVDVDKWAVEMEEGYFFINNKQKAVVAKDTVISAFEVLNVNGVLIQNDITQSNSPGIYVNKGGNVKSVITNDGSSWNAGEIVTCKVTENKDGTSNCKTFTEEETIEAGNYCYNKDGKEVGNKMYLITETATSAIETGNCLSAAAESPLYLTSDKIGGKLNGTAVSKLVKFNGEYVTLVKPGYYMVNQNNKLVEESGENVLIYVCDGSSCSVDSAVLTTGERFLSDGKIFEYDKDGKKLKKVTEIGLYVFNSEGRAASNSVDENNILLMNEDGSIEKIELESGIYINIANKNTYVVYDGESYSIKSVTCTYNKDGGSCANESVIFNIGDYCISDGKFYIINGLSGENNEIKLCKVGSDETPVYYDNGKQKLIMVKEKEIYTVSEEGYYAIDVTKERALDSEDLVNTKLIKCDNGGSCESVKPEVGSYLNRAPDPYAIAQFTGEEDKAFTIERECNVEVSENGQRCVVEDGELNAGDVCLSSNVLYLVGEDNNECVATEKTVDTYKIVNNKLYRLNDDSVVQLLDGYYFITKEGHAVTRRKDYEKEGTVGYICSKKGDCYQIEPEGVRYYIDYTTMTDNHFVVVKYDGSRRDLRKRQEEEGGEEEEEKEENTEKGDEEGEGEGNEANGEENEDEGNVDSFEEEEDEGEESEGNTSGIENITEPGVYKLDDGSYVECELDNNEEITCKNIDKEGSKMTTDGEVVACVKNDKDEIVCTQATEGGYYYIDDELMECTATEEQDKLECEKVDKEGYFISEPNDLVYECVEVEEEEEEEEYVPDKDLEDPDLRKRKQKRFKEYNVQANEVNGEAETESADANDNETENDEPKNVKCRVMECPGDPITIKLEDGESKDVYICSTGEDEESRYIDPDPESSICESGSYIKKGEDYYECDEEEKGKLDPNMLVEPNTEHTTSYQPRPTPTTAQETSAPPTKSSETSKPTSTPTQAPSGALSLIHKIPSITFYIILFVFAFLIQY
jgi:hypothetical protein